MKKLILLFCFIGCYLATYSQNQICVDGSAAGTGNGSAANPYKTIQAAVNAASNGDIIKVAKGTYAEAVKIEQKKVQLLGGYAGGGDFNTANPQTNVTIINGTNTAPCVYVYIDAQLAGALTISGFTIRNGQRGIELSGGWSGNLNNITIEKNTIENNGTQNTTRGGGIGLEGTNVTIQNNVIRTNKAGRGAGIGVTDDIVNVLIAGNHIENNTGYDDHAGGVSISGTGTISQNIFDGNIAAASYNYGWGGGILIFGDDNTKTSFTLSHNVYRNNQAPSRGGAVFVDDGAIVKMEHELLYNNSSGENGSAIYVDADWKNNPSTLNMNNCTISGNSPTAALFVQGSIVNIENSIFWNNSGDFDFMADGVSLAKLTVTYTLTQQGYTGTGNITSNPLFVSDANADYHLQSTAGHYNSTTGQWVNDTASSPAIDAGNPAAAYANEPTPNGGRVNMGCYGNTAEASKSAGSANEGIMPAEWTIYPNPAKESFTISQSSIGSTVHIIDLTGQEVYNSIIQSEQTTISTAGLTNGVYIVQVTNNGVVTARKIVVRN